MKILIFQIDAFTHALFSGNPAAICPLESWLSDSVLQNIARENNLSETAFFVPMQDGFEIRWFTPVAEVDLCGHATLAAACVLFNELNYDKDLIRFYSRSGLLTVTRESDAFAMHFPIQNIRPSDQTEQLAEVLGARPEALYEGEDFVAVYASAQEVLDLAPDFEGMKTLPLRGLVATAPGHNGTDFISRWFGPKLGVNEDPVTGSAHCALAPYWGQRLGKSSLRAQQLSARGGELECRLLDENVVLVGRAVKYLTGEIRVNNPDTART